MLCTGYIGPMDIPQQCKNIVGLWTRKSWKLRGKYFKESETRKS